MCCTNFITQSLFSVFELSEALAELIARGSFDCTTIILLQQECLCVDQVADDLGKDSGGGCYDA